MGDDAPMSASETAIDTLLDDLADRIAGRVLSRLEAALARPAIDRFLSANEVAVAMSCTSAHVRQLVASGKLPAARDGRRVPSARGTWRATSRSRPNRAALPSKNSWRVRCRGAGAYRQKLALGGKIA